MLTSFIYILKLRAQIFNVFQFAFVLMLCREIFRAKRKNYSKIKTNRISEVIAHFNNCSLHRFICSGMYDVAGLWIRQRMPQKYSPVVNNYFAECSSRGGSYEQCTGNNLLQSIFSHYAAGIQMPSVSTCLLVIVHLGQTYEIRMWRGKTIWLFQMWQKVLQKRHS